MSEQLSASTSAACDGLGHWLVAAARAHPGPEALFPAFCTELQRRGLPIWRGQLGLEVLHPEHMGWLLVWKNENLMMREAQRAGIAQSADYLNSPTKIVDDTDRPFRRRLDRSCPDMPLLEDLRNEGATDYFMTPLPFLDKQRSAVASFATTRPTGFSETELADLQLASALFSPYVERYVLRRIGIDLLDTYIGPRTGQRIIEGQIELGQVEHIDAAIWLADLRGFTRYSEEAPIDEVIAALNTWLKPMVAEIDAHGGEVLKFIGDAVLAIFPAVDHQGSAKACTQALAAATAFCRSMATINAARRADRRHVLDFGLVLHLGEVAYGNVGAPTRLDFTVIGPAVNRAARLQELTKRLGQPVLLSADFARAAACPLQDLGHHPLRDITEPQLIFAPLM